MMQDDFFKLSEIAGRAGLADYLTQAGLQGIAVEVGVHRAEFATQFLRRWKGMFIAVDPWEESIDGYEGQVEALAYVGGCGVRIVDMMQAVAVLRPVQERVAILKMTSAQAVRFLSAIGIEVDFVYLDANHQRDYLLADLNLWWQLVRPGGIFAGHDLCFPESPCYRWTEDTQAALREFFKPLGLTVKMISENHQPWSWFVEKQEMAP